MIISTPLSLPRLEPDDWGKWWDLWNTYSRPLTKVMKSPNDRAGLHHGFDVYKTPKFMPFYKAEYINLSILYPSLFEQIISLPVEIYGVRFVKSLGNFPSHVDNFTPSWLIRNLFHCDDPEQQWYYTGLTNPERQYLRLPSETNWWAYYDGMVKHGTDYRESFPKILVQIFSNPADTKKYAESEISKFIGYTHDYSITI